MFDCLISFEVHVPPVEYLFKLTQAPNAYRFLKFGLISLQDYSHGVASEGRTQYCVPFNYVIRRLRFKYQVEFKFLKF